MRERPLDICGTPAHRPAGKLAEARQTGEFEHTAFRTECPVAKRQEPIQQNVKNLFPPASPVSDPQPDSLPDLDHHLGTDRGFLSAYARALAALAMADGPVSMARFAALTEIARNSVTALVGTQIFFALEKNLAWNPALAALQKAAQTVSEPDRRGALEQAYPLLRCAGHRARPLARQLAGALRVPVSMADLGELPPEEDQGLLDWLQEVLRVTARSRTETDRLVEFGRGLARIAAGVPVEDAAVLQRQQGVGERAVDGELAHADANLEHVYVHDDNLGPNGRFRVETIEGDNGVGSLRQVRLDVAEFLANLAGDIDWDREGPSIVERALEDIAPLADRALDQLGRRCGTGGAGKSRGPRAWLGNGHFTTLPRVQQLRRWFRKCHR